MRERFDNFFGDKMWGREKMSEMLSWRRDKNVWGRGYKFYCWKHWHKLNIKDNNKWDRCLREDQGHQAFKNAASASAVPIRHVESHSALMSGMPVKLINSLIFIVILAAGLGVLHFSLTVSWVTLARLWKVVLSVLSTVSLAVCCIVLVVVMGYIIALKLRRLHVIRGSKAMLILPRTPSF